MKIEVDPSSLHQGRWYEYAVRFVFGGLITAIAGWVAKRYGPAIGGLLLAFPAIFPASATLVQKHEAEKKEKEGKPGRERGKAVAGVDAAGAAMGSIGLMAFSVVMWETAPRLAGWACLILALAAWSAVSFSVWFIHRKL